MAPHWPLLLALAAAADPAHRDGADDGAAVPDTDLPAPVVGGTPAPAGDWPAAAAITYGSGFVACSGVLIHPEWVLTAGHCSPSITAIYLDTVDLDAPGVVKGAAAFVAHPDAFTTFDVALVRLDSPAAVPPARMALDCVARDWLREGADVTLVGFGKTDAWAQQSTTLLNAADTAIVDPVCADVDSGCNAAAMPAGELIAGGDGVDSCDGDSGGPLFVWTGDGPFLAGTTSRAAIPAAVPCGDGGIYVRADAIADWVEQTAGITLIRPNCDGMNGPPVVDAAPIAVPMNQVGSTVPTVTDPNAGDTHTLALSTEPAHGWAEVADGTVWYVPDPGFYGDDSLAVTVTDDGDPPASTTLTIPIRVVPATGEVGGCTTAPGAPAPWWGLFLLLGVRRR